MESSGNSVSNEMQMLYEAQRRAHETILALQSQIEEEEAVYLEETSHGNIIRGWDGFIDSKQLRKDANPKKIKPYTEMEHLFSSCCLYKSMASEPSYDQVDIYSLTKDENVTRRKLTVTLSVGKGTGTVGSISGLVDSTASHHTNTGYKGSMETLIQKASKNVSDLATGKEAAALSYQHSKTSKLKKRKREAEMGLSASASLHETVSANIPTISNTPVTTGSVMTQPPASDFLDVL